jgi:hypothetical protein
MWFMQRETAAVLGSNCLQTFKLPPSGHNAPGPLHAVILNEDGNLYYSDEINHSVTSLSAQGDVRWQKCIKGSAPAEFWYPRGLSFGSIEFKGRSTACLAVCDSWNNRIQFMDCDGHLMEIWLEFNNEPFREVSDIRYLKKINGPISGSEGYWLILDRGNHRLCAVSESGEDLFQIGCCASPSLAERFYFKACTNSRNQSLKDSCKDFTPYDYIYYPTKIIGGSEDALFAFEPLRFQIKQILFGNLFPLAIGSDLEPVGADSKGILTFCQKKKSLQWHSGGGAIQMELPEGIPVNSTLASNEAWFQSNDRLSHYIWGTPDSIVPSGRLSLLRMSARLCIQIFDEAATRSAISEYVLSARNKIEVADKLWAMIREGVLEEGPWNDAWYGLDYQKGEHIRRRQRVIATLHNLLLGLFEIQLLPPDAKSADSTKPTLNELFDFWRNLAEPLQQTFIEVQKRMDALAMYSWSLSVPAKMGMPAEDLYNFSGQAQAVLTEELDWLGGFCAGMENPNSYVSLPWLEDDGNTDECINRPIRSLLTKPELRESNPASSCLREVDRISVALADAESGTPLILASNGNSDIYVSLFSAHRVLQLDRNGKLKRIIGGPGKESGQLQGPSGLGVDGNNRLWICEYSNHRIQVVDEKNRWILAIGSKGAGIGEFYYPMGICCLNNGSVLVADSGNHRIIRINDAGICELYSCSIDVEPQEIYSPMTFCFDREGSVWLVDRGNHRILRLKSDGNLVYAIGGFGLDKNQLFWPAHVVVFDDRCLAVAQTSADMSVPYPEKRCIKLFSPEGDEQGILNLDYLPGGMLVQDGMLWVADQKDNMIRVYERIQ